MSHLDEGTLHALLDGELDLAEVSEVQTHLGTCVACVSRLQEVKQFLAEADRLVGALEVPAASAGAGGSAAAADVSPRPKAQRKSPPISSASREPDPWEAPVILLPDATDPGAGRRRWSRAFRWAAMIAVVVGGGRLLLSAIHPGGSLPQARDITMAAPKSQPAVASPEETRRPEPVAPARNRPARTPAPAPNRNLAAKTTQRAPAPAAEALLDSASEPADSIGNRFADSAAAEPETLAAGTTAESVSTDSLARDTAPTDPPRQNDDLATRRAAAQALAELDRERRRERAAAATAALPPPAPARADAAPAAEAPPPPRTPEQRAQVYLRVGLDEAAKQLGGPVHVIEGMTPEFIGLTYGRLVAGADPNRPVVRVVYMDSRGRMILLDQQRLRTAQATGAPEGNLRWSVGDVMLYLRGEPGPEVLRNLQRRVR